MQFLNVDLEIGSRESLTALIVELVKRRDVHELYTGRCGGLARADSTLRESRADDVPTDRLADQRIHFAA